MDTHSHNSTPGPSGVDSTPGPSGVDEESITPFISDSEKGDLRSSEDSEVSEDEEDDTAVFKGATEKPLEPEKWEKLIARFPLPASNAPKLDKDISALIPKSAFTYDRLLSKVQQFNTDALGPLLHVLHRVKKGKCTAKELVAPLETAIRLTGNAAAHLSMQRRKALLKHRNR